MSDELRGTCARDEQDGARTSARAATEPAGTLRCVDVLYGFIPFCNNVSNAGRACF